MSQMEKAEMEHKNLLLSVVAPSYNEEGNLLPLANSLGPLLDYLIGADRWEFIFADNGSKDKTKEEVEAVSHIYTNTQYVYLKYPNIGEALKRGLEISRAPWSLIINVDWWDPLFVVWAWNIKEKYDLFVASKRIDTSLDQRSAFRRLLSWGLNSGLKLFVDYKGSDTHGPKLINMDSMKSILETCTMRRGQFDTELTVRAHREGLRIAEFPIGVTEIRKRRNLMIKKIGQNIIDLARLSAKVRRVPNQGPKVFKQYSRAEGEKAQEFLDSYGQEVRRKSEEHQSLG